MLLNTSHLKTSKAIHPKKFKSPFEGPFTIVKKLSNNVYELDLPYSTVFNKFHVSLLREYVESDHHPTDLRPPPVLYDGHEEYEVEQVLSHKKSRGQ